MGPLLGQYSSRPHSQIPSVGTYIYRRRSTGLNGQSRLLRQLLHCLRDNMGRLPPRADDLQHVQRVVNRNSDGRVGYLAGPEGEEDDVGGYRDAAELHPWEIEQTGVDYLYVSSTPCHHYEST